MKFLNWLHLVSAARGPFKWYNSNESYNWLQNVVERADSAIHRTNLPGGVLPYMGYIDMCRCEGMVFKQFTLGWGI